MKNISILGSTGSIGTQTLEVAGNNSDIKVCALAAYSNTGLLEAQARKFMPKLVCAYTEKAAMDLRSRLADTDIRVVTGMEGLIECAVIEDADMVVSAVVGMIGIRPVIEAIKAHKDIAFANKETLVTAGHIIMPMVSEYGVKLLPVDSEHSAIFQALQTLPEGEDADKVVSRLILTASGGPFRGRTRESLSDITVEDALKHPNWSMGRKITIDSSTMVNKGLEIIEAKWLFGMPAERIEVVIQPQSVIHSAIEYIDGSIIAQLGTPDMKLPIQYALFYPERRYLPGKRLDLFELSKLDFMKPDMVNFPGLKLAYDAINAGGSMPLVYNAANEGAVAAFLERRIRYNSIADIIGEAMTEHKVTANPELDKILETETEIYEFVKHRVESGKY